MNTRSEYARLRMHFQLHIRHVFMAVRSIMTYLSIYHRGHVERGASLQAATTMSISMKFGIHL